MQQTPGLDSKRRAAGEREEETSTKTPSVGLIHRAATVFE